MSVDLMTLLTFAFAVAMCRSSLSGMLALFLAAVLFQSAAAIKFGAIGITPGHVLLAIPFLQVFGKLHHRAALFNLIRFPNEGFWLLLICIYSLASGYFFPRLFFLDTEVNPIGTTMFEPSMSSVPLGPSSGNFTQPIYILGSFLVYVTIASLTRDTVNMRHMMNALLIYVALDIAFALLDLVAYWTGLGSYLSFIHNGNYVFHLDEVDVGLKRIAGAFSEAAAFATATLGTLAFTLRLWVGGIRPSLMAVLTMTQLILIVLSTSSTGYGGIVVVCSAFYLYLAVGAVRRGPSLGSAMFLIFAPLVSIGIVLAVRLNGDAWSTVLDLLDSVIFSKSSSDSAADRNALNAQAWVNFVDTGGLGAGAGSARTSSFPLAVLANIGLPGVMGYAAFLAMVLFRRSGFLHGTRESHIQSACRWGAFGVLVASTISGALVDLGELFFVLAGVATSQTRVALRVTDSLSSRPGTPHMPSASSA